MAYDSDIEIYKGKTIGSLFTDIVNNAEQKRTQLDILVGDLRAMIKTPENALMIVPLLKDYLDAGIKNDEQLIKMAAIVQRLISAGSPEGDGSAGGFGLSDEEKKQLMMQLDTTVKEINAPISTRNLPEKTA